MSTIKWGAPISPSTLLNTEMNSLADGAVSAAGNSYNNNDSAARYQWGDFELAVAMSTTTSSPAPFVEIYIIYSIDGTNYADGGGSVAPPQTSRVGIFSLRNTASDQVITLSRIPLSPFKFKVMVKNVTGQSLKSSGNVVRGALYNEDVS